MQSLSLIHALVLLRDGASLSRRKGPGRFVRSAENIARAQELAYRVLGRHLDTVPRKAQILMLLIEKMRDQVCKNRGISPLDYCFTKEEVCLEVGWSKKIVGKYLKDLKRLGYLTRRGSKYRLINI